MTKIPGMMLWTDAYLGDTTHLTNSGHGSYLLLLIAMWRSPHGKLKNDDILLAKIAKLTLDRWRRIAPTIREFFTIEGDEITQKRLQTELAAARCRAKAELQEEAVTELQEAEKPDNRLGASRLSGLAGNPLKNNKAVRVTNTKTKTKDLEDSTAPSEPCMFVENNNLNLSSSNSPLLAKVDSPRARAKPAAKPRLTVLQILEQSGLSPETARDLVAHRQAIRVPLTPRGAEMLAKQFAAFGDPELAVETMISKGWRGFKPEWVHPDAPVNGNGHYVPNGHGRSNGMGAAIRAFLAETETDDEETADHESGDNFGCAGGFGDDASGVQPRRR